MSTTGSRRELRRHVLRDLAVVGVVALAAGCGTARVESGSGAASSTVTSATPAATASSTPRSTVMPAVQLRIALATKALGSTFTVIDQDSGDYTVPSGIPLWGTLLKGDPACSELFGEPEGQRPDAFAYVFLETKSLSVEQAVESYATEASAEKAMQQKWAQVAGCKDLTVRMGDGEDVPMTLGFEFVDHGGLEILKGSLEGQTAEWVYSVSLATVRADGELMHLVYSSSNAKADPFETATTHFLEATSDYRKSHHR